MAAPTGIPGKLQFGPFELDLRTGELQRDGRRQRLQGQPAQLLAILVGHRGELVTREELRTQLWPEDTFVDFDHGLNNAINRIREALGDSASSPRYIETIPRRGYRFVGRVEERQGTKPTADQPGVPTPNTNEALAMPPSEALSVGSPWRIQRWLWIVLAFLAIATIAVGLGALYSRPPRMESIAVLPFSNLSGDPSQEYFADGMTDELTSDLGKIGALRVISRTSMMRYKGSAKTIPEIARELNVDGVVQGSVVHSGNRVRITAQLINGSSDRHLWAESYEQDLKDVLSLQDEVARDIAEQVRVRLTPVENSQLARRKPLNAEAYDAYLKGRYYFERRTDSSLKEAAEQFRQAIALDPSYAPAYAGVVDVLTTRIYYQLDAPADDLPEEKVAALKAVELDQSAAEAHVSMAAMNLNEWEWSKAEAEFSRAIALNPRYALAHHWYSDYLSSIGRHDEAIAEEKRALALDPLSPIINTWMGKRYYHARQYEQAYKAVQVALALDPGFEPALAQLGLICVQLKHYDEGIAALQNAVKSSGGSLVYVATLGYVQGMAGHKDDARNILSQLVRESKRKYVPYFAIAEIYAALGEQDQAIQWLTEAFLHHSDWMMYTRVDPPLDPLRDDARFLAILRKTNLPS